MVTFKQFVLEFQATPFAQGALDGLCGIYSVVNSVDAVLNQEKFDPEWAFRICINSIDFEFPGALYSGTTIDDVDLMLKALTRLTHKKYGWTVSWTAPFTQGQFKDADSFLSALDQQLDDKAVAIIGIAEPFAHWTVVQKTSAKEIKFFDSDGLTLVDKSKIALNHKRGKWIVTPEETRIIRNVT